MQWRFYSMCMPIASCLSLSKGYILLCIGERESRYLDITFFYGSIRETDSRLDSQNDPNF